MQVASYPKRVVVELILAASCALDCSAQSPATDQPRVTPAPPERQAPAVDLFGDPLPTGAIARMGTVRFRTDRGLHAAVHSADGKWLIGVGEDAICYWEADSGRLDAKIPIEKQNVQHVSVSDNRRWCCTFGFFISDDHTFQSHTLSVWNLEARQLERTIEVDREAQPSCLAITADGALITTGNRQGRVRIYETASGVELLGESIEGGDLAAIRFSPADRRVLATGYNTPLWVWDWENGAEPVSVPDLNGRFESLDVSPDGTYVAVGMGGPHGLQLRRTADWSRVDLPGLTGNYRWVQAAAFSPDGQFLATADYIREAVTLRSLSTGKVIHEWPVRPEHIKHLAFSADGQWLVAASEWNTAPPRIWNTQTGQPHKLVETGHRTAPASIEFVPDGTTVVTAGDDGTLRFWEATTGREVRMASHHPTEQPKQQYNVWIRAMVMSDDGRFVATSSLGDTVCLWDAATADLIYRLPGHGKLGGRRALAFSSDGNRLASFGDDMYLRVWDTKTGKALAEHSLQPGGMEIRRDEDGSRSSRPDEMLFMQMGASEFSRDASRMLLSMQSKIYVFDVETGRELATIQNEESGRVLHLAFSPDNELWATSELGRPVQTPLPGGGMHFSRERNQIVQIRQLRDGELRHKLVFPGGSAGPVAFSQDGKLLAAGMRNAGGPIRILSVESGETIAEITGFDSEPRALAFSNDGRLLASSLVNTTVLVWDWRQFQKK